MMKRNMNLPHDLRMALAALTATAVMASKVFRPVIKAGVAVALLLAALIAAVVAGRKIRDSRRSPWDKFVLQAKQLCPVRRSKWSFRF